ncbi:MEKHLA domain-containing protein [Synechococcus sp. PCC 7502]|uniref:MEKHLA domain-containing protein n=1 Tax=Synechococcus sp. PCC 7502 TaxID=1173263 RepID=UPI00029FC355|nr:MEKHLA domain-containing protein [Synechococcus sp. PCC 7502]AFY74029.1 MEKHLA domain-containing protein [Synechococcus sp. PCC 7502]
MGEPSSDNYYLTDHVELLRLSFKRLIGKEFFSAAISDQDLAKSIFYAPFMLLSHNTAPDPIFNYGNQTALHLFEMTWQELTKLPSRQSAEPILQEERSLLLKTVSEQGYINNYSGVRISKSGKRFLLQNAIVWNLIDAQGVYYGQAAICDQWDFL